MHAIHPPGYAIPGISQAMFVPAGNGLLLLSGHTALQPDGTMGGDLATQLAQVFDNLRATLREAGGDFTHVARLTLYVRDYRADMLSVIRAVRDRYVDAKRPPASALIGVAALALPALLVEVDAIAALPGA